MKLYITPYKLGSESAKLLGRGLNVLRTMAEKRFVRPTTLINWGRSSMQPRGRVLRIINPPAKVALAANKIRAFEVMQRAGVSTVEWTTERSKALSWIENDAVVFGRRLVDSSEGRGIHVLTQDDYTIPSLPLYTKGVVKAHEYRVHIAFNEVIDFTKKRRRSGEVTSEYIKNYANGWVFCRDGASLPEAVKVEAMKAIQALGLDFGALDIMYRERENKAFVLEINTAPGIEGTTLEKYLQSFRRAL